MKLSEKPKDWKNNNFLGRLEDCAKLLCTYGYITQKQKERIYNKIVQQLIKENSCDTKNNW